MISDSVRACVRDSKKPELEEKPMKKNDVAFDASRRNLLKSGATIAVIGAVATTGLLTSVPARV